MSFVPAHEVVEAKGAKPRACVFFLHGILGSRRNWLSFARRVTERFPDVRAVLVDLRNHGESHGASPTHDLEAAARDLAELAAHLGEEPRVVIGHSYGGKVALVYARDFAAALDDVWVLDSSPGLREGGGKGSVESVIAAVSTLPLPIPGRKELVDALRAKGLPDSIAQWMTTNLRPTEGGFEWRFDLPAVIEMLEDYGRQDLWPMLDAPPPEITIHFVRGERSDRWTHDDIARLEKATERGLDLRVLPNAGHWVHTDNPDDLFAFMEGTFARL